MRERHSPHVTARRPAWQGRIPVRGRLLTDAIHALTLVNLKIYPREPAPGSGGLLRSALQPRSTRDRDTRRPRHLAYPGGIRPAEGRAGSSLGARASGDREEDRGRPRRGRPARERWVSRGQGGTGQAGGPDQPDPAHPAERQGRGTAADRRRGWPGDDGDRPLRRRRRRGHLPARLARGERVTDRRLFPPFPAGQRHRRQEGRRDRDIHHAERPRRDRRDSRGGPLRGSLNRQERLKQLEAAAPGPAKRPGRGCCRYQPTSSVASGAASSVVVALRPRSGTSLRKQARTNTSAAAGAAKKNTVVVACVIAAKTTSFTAAGRWATTTGLSCPPPALR